MTKLLKNLFIIGPSIALTASVVHYTSPVQAEEKGNSPVPTEESGLLTKRAAQMQVATQDMRVYRDPQTGRLGPRPAGVAPLGLTISEQRMLSRSDQGLKSRTLPRGGVALDLQGRFRNMSIATIGSGEQATVNCVITPSEAVAIFRAGHQSATEPTD